MLSKYFSNFDKNITKKSQPSSKKSSKKSTKKTAKSTAQKGGKLAIDVKKLKESLNRIVPFTLAVDSAAPVTVTGFSPEGADLIAYKKYNEDIIEMMDGYIPFELIHGTYHVVHKLDKKSLVDALERVVEVKKMNRFSESGSEAYIPPFSSFIITADTTLSFQEIKEDILEFYVSRGIDHDLEMDILALVNRGVVVKNWREKRSFIALETNEDTSMWFAILMNEYLEVEKEVPFDMRNYVRKDIVYREY